MQRAREHRSADFGKVEHAVDQHRRAELRSHGRAARVRSQPPPRGCRRPSRRRPRSAPDRRRTRARARPPMRPRRRSRRMRLGTDSLAQGDSQRSPRQRRLRPVDASVCGDSPDFRPPTRRRGSRRAPETDRRPPARSRRPLPFDRRPESSIASWNAPTGGSLRFSSPASWLNTKRMPSTLASDAISFANVVLSSRAGAAIRSLVAFGFSRIGPSMLQCITGWRDRSI